MVPAFDSTTYLLQKMAHRSLDAMEAAVEPLGITARQYLALAIAGGQADLSQNEIAARLGVDATVLGRLLGDLEERGYLERRRSREDRRRHELVISATGKKLLVKAQVAASAAEEAALAELPAADRAALRRLLRRATGHDH
jgi:DNA-binding MarR family transcriptional regulator